MPVKSLLIIAAMLMVSVSGAWAADTRTSPKESLSGLRPGSLTVDQLTTKLGKPDVTTTDGLLSLYGGDKSSEVYGWFMIENPNYTVPDLAVETAPGSNRVDLVMAIGYDGFKTEKGITCFATEAEVIEAYGKPAFAFAVPMQGFVLRELYYPELGLSFDIAPTSQTAETREVIAIYVTYPEYMQRAIDLRKQYIKDGTGRDVTYVYRGGTEA